MPLIRAELPSLCRLTRRWQSDKPCRDGAPRGEVKEGESAQEYSAGAALEHGQGSGGQWSMDQSLQQNQAWPTALHPEPTLGSTSQRRSRSLAVVRTHSRQSGPGGCMLYRSEANACVAFITANNNQVSLLLDRQMISLVWLTAGRSLKPICMLDVGGTPGLGGSLSWCNEESPHRCPVLGQDQLRDIR